MFQRIKTLVCRQDGIEVIEFIALLPLLIMVALIIFQVMLGGFTIITAMSAAREGARAAAVCGNIKEAVDRASPGFSATANSEYSGDYVKVTVTLPLLTVPNPFFSPKDVPIQGSATMRREQMRCTFR